MKSFYKIKSSIINIDLFVIALCNYKCNYCYIIGKEFTKSKFLKKEKIFYLISQLETLPNFNVNILGGEPFLYPYLNILIDELIKLKNINKITIFTNGSKKIKLKDIHKKINIVFSYHSEEISNYNDFKIFNENIEYCIGNKINYHIEVMLEHFNVRHEVKNIQGKKIFQNIKYDGFIDVSYDNNNRNFALKTGKTMHYFNLKEIFETKINRFNGWYCTFNSFVIEPNLKIKRWCSERYLSFNEISNKPFICQNNFCENEYGLEHLKYDM